MKAYYFLASLLPPLEIGHVPVLAFPELKRLMETNLSKEDSRKAQIFLSLVDFENLRSYWAKEDIDPRGNFTSQQLEQALSDHIWPNGLPFPSFLTDYLEKYKTNEERLHYFHYLISEFFLYQIEENRGFLQDFFSFQRDIRLVLVGFRAKRFGRDLASELQFEDPNDPIVAQILAQKDAKTYEPPFEYKELKPLFEHYADAPLELHKSLYEYQFNHIIEMWGGDPFTIDRILNYMARLILVERWLELDFQKGIQVVDTIEKEIS